MTAKQKELLDQLLSGLDEGDRAVCVPLIDELLRLGYAPKRHRKNTFVVEFVKYGRILVKFEIGHDGRLKFHMRYSACEAYPEIFAAAAGLRSAAWVKRGQYWEEHDVKNCCGWCAGHPRFYRVSQDNGTQVNTCGGFTKYVPGVTREHVPEIIEMMREQDRYFAETFA